MNSRKPAQQLAAKHLAAGDPLGWFEVLYAAADDNPERFPGRTCNQTRIF
jgi:hypothetical protein